MPFGPGQKSKERMVDLDPDLSRVVLLAWTKTPIDFMVVQGVRSKEEAYANWGKGRTVEQLRAAGVPNPAHYARPADAKVTWLRTPLGSKHIGGKAVDLLPEPYDWKDRSRFEAVAKAMKEAASELGVAIAWGGDWKSSPDFPHFELTK